MVGGWEYGKVPACESEKKKWLRHRRKKQTNRRSCAYRSQGMFQKEWSDQLRQMMLINLIR